ncbi:ankyrin [Corynespora cassiicola Philippines]|uniref:Ankyrin n=1 Tax=Corynespora cassiicola Philippines TaxID=1448308 RepID=A0A2T2NNB8_CORCC|nr:ankyrin [Corynespora cassiicola Philippines]
MLWKLNEKFFAKHFEKRPGYALHVAARFGDTKFMQQLINNGHDLEKFDSVYGTPLHVAIKCNQLQAFQLLLSAGADPDALDSRGEGHGDNSLRLAVRVGRREMFKISWDKGVNRKKYHPDVYWRQRLSLLEVAAFETPDAIVADLVEWSDEWTDLDVSRSLVVASTHHRAGVLKILLGRWNFSQEQLEDAIWFCCDSGPCLDQSRDKIMDYSESQAKSVEAILDSRPTLELNMKLLRISENWYIIPTMKLLLERGANPNFPCKYS